MELTDPKHFKTTDAQLALALSTAGCTLAPQEEGGPAQNIYTPEHLRSIRRMTANPVSTTEFERVARETFDRNIPGNVCYLFVRDAVFERSIKAWDEMVEEMQHAKDEGRKPVLPDIDEATVMRVLYLRRLNEKEFARVPFFNSPLCAITETKTEEKPVNGKPAPRVVSSGSGKVWTLGNKAMREAVGA